MIHRANHDDGYLCVLNSTVRDTRLSCGAVGLLVYMLSMSDDWEFSIKGLAFDSHLPEQTIMRLVNELKKTGYVKQSRKRNERGQLGAPVWEIYEEPVLDGFTKLDKNLTMENPNLGKTKLRNNLTLEEPNLGKRPPIRNTNSKEIPNIRSTNGKKYIPGRGEFLNVFISDSEFEKLTERFGDIKRDSLIEDLSRYLAAHPKKKYASHYATMLAWARKDEKDTTATPAPIPINRDGDIDWDRVAQLAEKGGSA